MAIVAGYTEADMGALLTVNPGMSWIGSVYMAMRTSTTAVAPFIEVVGGGAAPKPAAGTKVLAVILVKDGADHAVMPEVYLEADNAPMTLRLRFNGAIAGIGIANGYDGGVAP